MAAQRIGSVDIMFSAENWIVQFELDAPLPFTHFEQRKPPGVGSLSLPRPYASQISG